MHENSNIMAENIYMEPIYIDTRLGLGIYSLHIHIHSDLSAFTQCATQYIYIYIGLNPSYTRPNPPCTTHRRSGNL